MPGNLSHSSRMLKKSAVLTHPTPASQDSPFRRQGRTSAEVDLNDARTLLGAGYVSAHQGWAGENNGFFSILLQAFGDDLLPETPHILPAGHVAEDQR